MKFCTKCGAQMEDTLNFCTACGADQKAVEAPAPISFSASDWDGGVLDTVVNSIVASLITTFTCGIATPWAICYMMNYLVSHAVVDGKRLVFNGTGGELFVNWIKWLLLTIITCGIYGFWVTPRLYKWIVSHIHVSN